MITKEEIRRQIQAALHRKNAAECASDSAAICSHLSASPAWKKARGILFFSPIGLEPDISPLLEIARQDGIIAALPSYSPTSQSYEARRYHGRDRCGRGKYGILEPDEASEVVPMKSLDFLMVPGVGFDLMGRRLGRGKGFYDRLLGQVEGIKCGIAFDEQVVSQVPVEPHDIHMNCVVTPTRWCDCQ